MKTKLTLLFIIVCLFNNTLRAQLDDKWSMSKRPTSISFIYDHKKYLTYYHDGDGYFEKLGESKYNTSIFECTLDLSNPYIYVNITGVIIDGKKESVWKVEKWGKTIREETYFNNLLHGVRRSFSPKDSLSSPLHQTIFRLGTGFYVDYYPNDQIQIMGQMIDGERDGEWQEFYPSGKLKTELYYSKGLLAGKKTTYFEDGKINIEANYKGSLLDGKYTIYSTEGEILYTTLFKQGAGLYKLYDTKTNELLEEGNFEQGYRVGKWVLWTYYKHHYTDERKRYSTFKNYSLEEEKNKKLFYSVVGDTDVYNIMVDVVNE